MSLIVASILIVIGSQVVYQLAQKSVPPALHPFAVLAIAYIVAAALSFLLAPLMGRPIILRDLRQALGWPTYLLALSVVGIEFGYLLAYRQGWKIGIAFALASTVTVVILAAIGARWFGESIGARQVIGLVLALAGAWLLTGAA